jgi:hypothetical protein
VAAFAPPSAFGALLLTTGPVALAVGAFTAAPAFPAVTVSAGSIPAQSLSVGAFNAAPAFPAMTVLRGPVALIAAAFTPPPSFGGLTVTGGVIAAQRFAYPGDPANGGGLSESKRDGIIAESRRGCRIIN